MVNDPINLEVENVKLPGNQESELEIRASAIDENQNIQIDDVQLPEFDLIEELNNQNQAFGGEASNVQVEAAEQQLRTSGRSKN